MKSFTEGTFTRDADGRLRFHFRGRLGSDDGADAPTETPPPSLLDEEDDSWLWTHEQMWEFFEQEVHRYLGISAEEFLRRWDAGEWPDPDSVEHVMGLVMLIPFVRPHVKTG